MNKDTTRFRRSRAAALLLAVALPAGAEVEPAEEAAPASRPVNLLEASQLARDTLGGAIIKAELTRHDGRDAYRVRLLDQGRVRDVLVDAATGRMLSPLQAESAE
ncbi:PepSY domain-containing protein [Marinobacterium weihaiense]|uniref:PepSY domain-containing protein n=1 Tax=Marinobacterium weihaiense TaxID=2851016 RepID=A0ABS6MAD4_9GAMM|nr:PepSY domain-containing protein [Marinobacterium weihaiense]MBV0933249.1 PepSY domain-containing protein [Marinobacterium weihaiense]